MVSDNGEQKNQNRNGKPIEMAKLQTVRLSELPV